MYVTICAPNEGLPACQYICAALDAVVADAFPTALAPPSLMRCRGPPSSAASGHGAAHQRGAAARAQALRRRIGGTPFNRVDPDNRLVAAELERRWEEALSEVRVAEEALVQQSSP
jgi:hypothetical protein